MKPEVQPKAEHRRLSAEYKRRITEEASRCQHGELGSLLRREGLTYAHIHIENYKYCVGSEYLPEFPDSAHRPLIERCFPSIKKGGFIPSQE